MARLWGSQRGATSETRAKSGKGQTDGKGEGRVKKLAPCLIVSLLLLTVVPARAEEPGFLKH